MCTISLVSAKWSFITLYTKMVKPVIVKVLLLVVITAFPSASPALGNLIEEKYDKLLYNKGLFEGDILITGDRNAVVGENLLWPNGQIFYELSESIAFSELFYPNILQAMAEIENKTCIRFYERTSYMQDYVRIEELDGCWSAVGRQGGEQIMSLVPGCHFHGTLLHELSHVIGLYHEHSRADRDDYIEILWDNVEPGMKNQLMKMKPWEHNLLLEDFDYESVMLYGEDAFSKDNGLATIRVLKSGRVIGSLWEKHRLADSDVRRINKLYQCFGEERPPPPKTPDYVCTFEAVETCQLQTLDENVRMERLNDSLGSGAVLLVEALQGWHRGGRFATPFLEVFGQSDGCFSLDYYFPDESATHLRIYREDLDETIEFITVFPQKINSWQRITKNVLLPDFGLRFIVGIEGDFATGGRVIINNISFSFEACI